MVVGEGRKDTGNTVMGEGRSLLPGPSLPRVRTALPQWSAACNGFAMLVLTTMFRRKRRLACERPQGLACKTDVF